MPLWQRPLSSLHYGILGDSFSTLHLLQSCSLSNMLPLLQCCQPPLHYGIMGDSPSTPHQLYGSIDPPLCGDHSSPTCLVCSSSFLPTFWKVCQPTFLPCTLYLPTSLDTIIISLLVDWELWDYVCCRVLFFLFVGLISFTSV